MKKIVALTLALLLCIACFAGCGGSSSDTASGTAGNSSSSEKVKDTVYTPVDTMAKALLEIKSGTADAAVVDSVMAEAMVGEGTDYSDLMIIKDLVLAEEEYGIGLRSGSTAVDEINKAIKSLKDDGKLAEIAAKYDLTLSLIDDFKASAEEGVKADTEKDDWGYIKNKGKLIIGITEYAPMNYYDESGKLIGFDTEFAEAVCEALGIEAEFVVINWETKEIELEAKSIDCIWNGFTVNDERFEQMDFSGSYMLNKQIVVIRAADAEKYKSIETLKGASFVAEKGSAGEETIQGLIADKKL